MLKSSDREHFPHHRKFYCSRLFLENGESRKRKKNMEFERPDSLYGLHGVHSKIHRLNS